jgi:hypothetical protein
MMQGLLKVELGMVPAVLLLFQAMHVANQPLSKSHEFSRSYTSIRLEMRKDVRCQEKVDDGAQYPLPFGRARIYGVDI